MRSWFKSRDDVNAERALTLVQAAAQFVHPDRFPYRDDRVLVCQPLLVTLNRLLGKDDDRRFTPATYDELVARVRFFESRGLLSEVGTLLVESDVLIGLVIAAAHENHLTTTGQSYTVRNRGAQIRAHAEFVLECLNDVQGC